MARSQVVLTSDAPSPIGPYSQAIEAGGFLFCSGQIGLDPKSGQMASLNVDGQMRQVMKNLEAVLRVGGCEFIDVVKVTIFLKSMKDFPKMNEIYASYFPSQAPARSTVEVSQLPKGALVEVDLVAVMPY